MKIFSSFKMATKFASLFIITSLFFFGCKKTSDIISPVDTGIVINPSDLTTKVNSSVSGFVTDGNNVAVKDAIVLIGVSTVLTDKYGYFEIRNVQVVQNAAVVTVSKMGFFNGIKTYIASANKAAFFRIKLMPKLSAGTVNGAAGGVVTMTNGLSISFPASAIMNASTNVLYTGLVTVTAFYINPTATDINSIMPGDLRGINTGGEMKLLTSYGMAAIELKGASGELLQIATGKKATLTMPIPTLLSSTSPASIPLWYFNETNGLWKQEGSATKTGNAYIGDVSHFSFWNCDVPNNYVQFNCTVVNTAGQPIQNAFVKISLVSNPLVAAFGYTDSAGYVNGAVPNNSQLKLEVFANNNCGTASLSQIFSTTNLDLAFGNVIINTTTSIATLVGTIKNCAGAPVTNGYIIVRDGNTNIRYNLSSSGSYNLSKLVCGFPSNITLIGEDIANSLQSQPLGIVINNAGINNVQNISACGITTQEFINYTINGVTYNYTKPIDTFFISVSLPNPFNNNLKEYNFSGGRIPIIQTDFVSFSLFASTFIQGGSANLYTINSPQILTPSTFLNPVIVNFTEYSGPGQFLAGNFTGTKIKNTIPTAIYNFSCSFRLRM